MDLRRNAASYFAPTGLLTLGRWWPGALPQAGSMPPRCGFQSCHGLPARDSNKSHGPMPVHPDFHSRPGWPSHTSSTSTSTSKSTREAWRCRTEGAHRKASPGTAGGTLKMPWWDN